MAAASRVVGALSDGFDNVNATCGREAKGIDAPFRFDLATRSRVRFLQKSADFRPVVHVRRGDYLMVHTGHIARCLSSKSWDGYSGGDAPGLAFETVDWLYKRQVAGIATDTWGAEVRPNELPGSFQPLHLVLVVNMGLLVGEIFNLEALAADCAADGVYEFMFVAPPLPITGAVGSPINPQAIK